MNDRSKGEVWVFAEQEEGKIADIAFELLGKGRELADKLGVKLGAVLIGSGSGTAEGYVLLWRREGRMSCISSKIPRLRFIAG